MRGLEEWADQMGYCRICGEPLWKRHMDDGAHKACRWMTGELGVKLAPGLDNGDGTYTIPIRGGKTHDPGS